MAVRFLPSSEDRPDPVPEREGLAEVIELRSLLAKLDASASPRPSSGTCGTDAAAGPDAMPEPRDVEREPDARGDAVRLLARRAMSSEELRGALLDRAHEAHEVERLVAEFEESLYLDDAGLARAIAERLRETKGASRSQIRVKLRARRLRDATIDQALAAFDDGEERELLRAAAEDRARRLGGLDRQTAERRLLGYLARRGWSGGDVYGVVREVLAEA